MQLVASVFILLAGLYIAVLSSVPDGFKAFGWVLVVIGGLGLVIRLIIAGGGRRGRDQS